MKVSYFEGRTGRPIYAQVVVLEDDGSKTFTSYGTTIAHITSAGAISFDVAKWNYSATTRKYLARFVRENTDFADAREAIKSGAVEFVDLNKEVA